MSANRAKVVPLGDLVPDQQADFFAVLRDRVRGMTREGKPYFHCRFGDARRTVSLMVWNDDRWYALAERDWQPGSFYKLRAVYIEHERYGPQIELINLRPVKDSDSAEGFDPAELVEMPPQEPTLLLGELRAVAARHIAHAGHRALVLDLLEQHAEALLRLPATRDRAYPYRGGLVEHTLGVATLAVDLAARFAARYPKLNPPLNQDLVCAAAILHDIGRVAELGDEAPTPALTISGRLAGPFVLGRDLVREAARSQTDVDPEWLALLEHLLLTHSGSEVNGVKGPLIPEGVLVQQADELDIRMSLYVRCLERDTSSGPFTERDPALGRALLKSRKV